MPATIVVACGLVIPMPWCGWPFSAVGERVNSLVFSIFVKPKFKNFILCIKTPQNGRLCTVPTEESIYKNLQEKIQEIHEFFKTVRLEK